MEFCFSEIPPRQLSAWGLLWWPRLGSSFLSPQALLVSEPLMLPRCSEHAGLTEGVSLGRGGCVCMTPGSLWPEVLFWSVQDVFPSLCVLGSDIRTGGGPSLVGRAAEGGEDGPQPGIRLL